MPRGFRPTLGFRPSVSWVHMGSKRAWIDSGICFQTSCRGRRPAQVQPKAETTPRGYGHINDKKNNRVKKHVALLLAPHSTPTIMYLTAFVFLSTSTSAFVKLLSVKHHLLPLFAILNYDVTVKALTAGAV